MKITEALHSNQIKIIVKKTKIINNPAKLDFEQGNIIRSYQLSGDEAARSVHDRPVAAKLPRKQLLVAFAVSFFQS